MQMTFRWYGEGNDTVTAEQIGKSPESPVGLGPAPEAGRRGLGKRRNRSNAPSN